MFGLTSFARLITSIIAPEYTVVKKSLIDALSTTSSEASQVLTEAVLTSSQADIDSAKKETKTELLAQLQSRFAEVESRIRSNAYSMSTETQNALLNVKNELATICRELAENE